MLSLALPTKDHLSELLAKALDLLRIRCGPKVLGKFEEGFLLPNLTHFGARLGHMGYYAVFRVKVPAGSIWK
jgi:hypothetical protein